LSEATAKTGKKTKKKKKCSGVKEKLQGIIGRGTENGPINLGRNGFGKVGFKMAAGCVMDMQEAKGYTSSGPAPPPRSRAQGKRKGGKGRTP